MAGIAALLSVPETPEQMLEWSFAHNVHHQLIAASVFSLAGVSLPVYPLDPINLVDFGGWLAHNQTIHTAQNAVLGISGFDLSDVDWRNRAQFAHWIAQHASEHYQASTLLQIG